MQPTLSSALVHTANSRGLAPIPAWEMSLRTAVAKPYFKVSDQPLALEGPAFDRRGDLLFVDVHGGRVLKLSRSMELSTVYCDPTLRPAGLAIHRDGRIFVAGLGDFKSGAIVAIDAEGKNFEEIVPASAGFVPDDLVFDDAGGLYFTDFKGSAFEPSGGVYYVKPDLRTIVAVLPRMALANGVALSPDGKVLWATEFGLSRLHRVELKDATTIAPFGSTVPHHFSGKAPDSMRTDREGNVYVAMYTQGRIMVFSPDGMPIGQILMPGRDQNHFLKTSSLALVQGSDELLIVARDEHGDGGAMIFKAQGFAEGLALFSHT
ncbi:MAG: SMP-30/gluconolactonase/LRE family protein [Bordetella sp.]|nr:SMP-30/gluconolactonase/LRE family protein [Bordetella sp.]